MSIAVLIPPIAVVVVTAFSWWMWNIANLRSKEFDLSKEFELPKEVELSKDISTLSVEDLKSKVDTMTSRLAWFTAITAYVISAMACILVSVIVIREMRRDQFGRYIIVLVSVSLVNLIYWLFRSNENSGPKFLDKLLERTSGDVVSHRVLGLLNGLAFVGIAFIVAGSCSVIASTGRSADDISHQVDSLGMLLYVGAALLVTSVVEINQLHRWSSVVLTSEDTRHEVHRTAAALALTVGVAFTLMLGAAYLPAFLVLRSRAIPVHLSIGSTFQTAVNLALVFSPLLVGLASSFWNSLPVPASSSNT
jgi:hypothetical protein